MIYFGKPLDETWNSPKLGIQSVFLPYLPN